MSKKNYLMLGLMMLLIIAGVSADIFFWKHISSENQYEQNFLQTKINTLSEKVNQQQIALSVLQSKMTAVVRNEQRGSTQQTLNEVAYLLNIANLYLQINHDRVNTIKSLQIAQRHIQMLQDPTLLALQSALAHDLNRLNDFPEIETTDILLKMQTLSESIAQLDMAREQTNVTPTQTKEISSENNQSWYQRWLKKLWMNFKSLFSIRDQNSSHITVLPANQRAWVRENIAFTLAQAQWAVLQQKQTLYQHSLTLVREWLMNDYPDNAQRTQILERLNKLIGLNVAPDLPDINASLHAVVQAMEIMSQQTPSTVRVMPTPETSTPPSSPTTPPSEKTTPPAPTPVGVEI